MEIGITPIFQVSKSTIEKAEYIAESLPNSPLEIASIALSNGRTIKRLACCIKLLKLFKESIPVTKLSASEGINIDNLNPNFEKDLTISSKFKETSITTIFSCVMASIGAHAVDTYMENSSSPDPFAQCARVAFRLTWLIHCRHEALVGIVNRNPIKITNNALRLSSFPDYVTEPQRAALFSSLSCPNKIDIRLLAYSLPKRILRDSSKSFYSDLQALLNEEKKEQLEILEIKVEKILVNKETPKFIGTSLTINDSLVAYLTINLDEISNDPYREMVNLFLFEMYTDKEMLKFKEMFKKAAEKASKLSVKSVKKYFTIQHFVLHDIPPTKKELIKTVDMQMKNNDKNNHSEFRRKKIDVSLVDMFLPQKDFIGRNKNMR